MSTEGIVVTVIIWFVYGMLSAFQRQKNTDGLIDLFMRILLCGIFAPIILGARIVIGAFHPFTFRDKDEKYQ